MINHTPVKPVTFPVLILVFVYCIYVYSVNIQWYESLQSSSWVMGYLPYIFVWFCLLVGRIANNILSGGSENFTMFLLLMAVTILTKSLFLFMRNFAAAKFLAFVNVILSLIIMKSNVQNETLSLLFAIGSAVFAIYDFLIYSDIELLNT